MLAMPHSATGGSSGWATISPGRLDFAFGHALYFLGLLAHVLRPTSSDSYRQRSGPPSKTLLPMWSLDGSGQIRVSLTTPALHKRSVNQGSMWTRPWIWLWIWWCILMPVSTFLVTWKIQEFALKLAPPRVAKALAILFCLAQQRKL